MDSGRLPPAGVFHYKLEKSILTAQATLRIHRTETEFEIEFDLCGRLPLGRSIAYWQRTVLPLTSRDLEVAVAESGPNRESLEWRHEIRDSRISVKSRKNLTVEYHSPGMRIHTPLGLLAALLGSDASSLPVTDPPDESGGVVAESHVFYARFISGMKLYAFEARLVTAVDDRRVFETRWCSLTTLESLPIEISWPHEKLAEAAPLMLHFNARESKLIRAVYMAPVLGAVVLELSGAEVD